MSYAYEHDCPFEAFITNLGKYNEGALVGEWVKFPTTAEELQKVFERIGIGSKDDFGRPYEEWFITDYDCYVDGLYEMLGEYENLDELNYLASKLEELDDHDYEHFQAAMQVSDYTGSVKDLINLIDNLDKYEIYPGVEDYSDLGHYYIDEVGVMEIPEHLANYIDYEAYGRDVAIDEMGQFTNYGYVRDIFINKQVERVSRNAVDELDSKEVILIFPSQKKNNKTVRLLKIPKTDTSERKVYIPKFVAQILVDIKKEQDELKDILGSEYQDYNLVMATTFGLPIGDSYLRDQMQKVIDEQGLPDVVFHSLRHTSVTYKLKLSGGDIKAVQGDSGHAQADMVTEVYGHIIDEDRRKNAQRMEDAFYNRENLNPQMKGADAGQTANTVAVPEGVDADLLMKVLGNPEMAALLTSLAKSLKAE